MITLACHEKEYSGVIWLFTLPILFAFNTFAQQHLVSDSGQKALNMLSANFKAAYTKNH